MASDTQGKAGSGSNSGASGFANQAAARIRTINPNAAKTSTASGIAGVKELGSMAVAYTKQETVAPLKGLARYVAWGLAAALCFATGLFLFALGALRGIQAWSGAADAKDGGLDGNLTFVPYLLASLVCMVVLGVIGFAAVKATKSTSPSHQNRL